MFNYIKLLISPIHCCWKHFDTKLQMFVSLSNFLYWMITNQKDLSCTWRQYKIALLPIYFSFRLIMSFLYLFFLYKYQYSNVARFRLNYGFWPYLSQYKLETCFEILKKTSLYIFGTVIRCKLRRQYLTDVQIL